MIILDIFDPLNRRDILIFVVFATQLIILYTKREQFKFLSFLHKDSYESLEAKLASSEEATNALIAIDENGTILSTNKATEKLFGWTKRGLINNNISILAPERFKKEQNERLKTLKETGYHPSLNSATEFTCLKQNGTEVIVSLTLKKSEYNDKKIIYVGVLKDLTWEKEKEDIHKERLKFCNSAIALYEEVETIGKTGGFVWDLETRMVRLTKGMRVIFDSEAKEVTLEHFMRRIASIDKEVVNKAVDKVFAKENAEFKCKIIRPDTLSIAEVNFKMEFRTDKDNVIEDIYGFVTMLKTINYRDAGFL